MFAAAVTATCALVVTPLVAFGDDGTSSSSAASDVAAPTDELVEVRAEIAADMQEAREEAPLELPNDTCGATMDVDGLGDTCRTDDGLLRVELEDGTSFTTHGADAPPLEAALPHLPASQAAIDGADVGDIACTPTTSKHITLVYARPSNAANRYATIKPKLQQAAYEMSAFIDAESQAVHTDHGKRLRLRCEADGTPTVLNATVPPPASASGVEFGELVSQLKDLGYDHYTDSGALERYLIFYDAPSKTGAAGTGHLYEDSSAGGTNLNNKGGMYAVEYRWSGDGLPHWDVLLHEAGHNMGALSDEAPDSSGAGHCNDGLDVMCYNDGGSTSAYSSSHCATEQFDCQRDSYFNPAPAGGSYLATHWNAAASYNSFLEHRFLGDVTPPTAPPSLVQSGASDATIGISWSASTDNRGVTSYRYYLRPDGGTTWVQQGTSGPYERKRTITLLDPMTNYEVAVRAYDAAGNVGPMAVIDAATNDQPDVTAPNKPSAPVTVPAMKSVRISWSAAADNVGVAHYEVLREIPTSNPDQRDLRSAGTTHGTGLTVTSLAPGRAYILRIVAHDDAANESEALRVVVRTLPDRAAPTMVPAPRINGRGTSFLRVAWGTARDNVGVTRYHVYRKRGTRWIRVASLNPRARSVYVRRLSRRTTYRFRVRAADAAGNLSRWSSIATARTL